VCSGPPGPALPFSSRGSKLLLDRPIQRTPAAAGSTPSLSATIGSLKPPPVSDLDLLGWSFVIRDNILVESDEGESKPAAEWVCEERSRHILRNARVTADRTHVRAYGKRFTIEETFRDQNDLRFGLGLSSTHIKAPARRDRLLMLAAFTQGLLTWGLPAKDARRFWAMRFVRHESVVALLTERP
jgi:hypothetical protein